MKRFFLFNVYAQGIHSRSDSKRNTNTICNSDGIELFLRPDVGDIEDFYNSISNHERKTISNVFLSWLEKNIFSLKEKFSNVKFITVNVESLIIPKVKEKLLLISKKLRSISVFLLVEITERRRIFDRNVLNSIYELNDYGVKFAIDDLTILESRKNIIKLNIFEVIKIKISDYYFIPNRYDFMREMLNENKKIIIENVESPEDVKRLLCEPINFFQGYLFCKPVLISDKKLRCNA